MKKILLIALVTLFSFSSTFAINGFKVVFNQTGAAVDVQVKIVELSTGTELYAGPTNNYTPNASGIISVNVPAIPGIDPVNITNSTYVRVLVNTTIHSQRKLNEMIFEQAQAQAAASEPIGDVTVSDGGELKFAEPAADGNNYTAFKSPALAGNVIYTLPVDDGDANQVLTTDGSGILSWTTPSGGGGGGSGGGEVTTGTPNAITLSSTYQDIGVQFNLDANTAYMIYGDFELTEGASNDNYNLLLNYSGTTTSFTGLSFGSNKDFIEDQNRSITNGSVSQFRGIIIVTNSAGLLKLQMQEHDDNDNPGTVDLLATGLVTLIKIGASSSAGGSGSTEVYTEVSSATTLTTEDQVVYISGDYTVTLPDPPATGQTIKFISDDVNATLNPQTQAIRDRGTDYLGTSDLFDFGGANQYQLTLYYNGTKWLPISK